MSASDGGPIETLRGLLLDYSRNLPSAKFRAALRTEFGLLPKALVKKLIVLRLAEVDRRSR